ncbi:MAG: M48 family metalloprotease [bacterium]
MRAGPALLLALLLGGAVAASADSKKIDDIDAAPFGFGSMAIGQAKDVDYARAEGLGLVPASPLDAYLNGILAKLLAQSPVTNVPARVYVRASGDWAAKSTADANIYVALGTLLRLDNEDEVAALLAHEASHVILGHADADIVQSVQQRAVQLSALAAQAQSAIASNGKPAGAAAKPSTAARVDEQSQALVLNTVIIVPAWTRGQERDADRLGTDLLVRAGYAPQAMTSLLRKQQSVETERAKDPNATHLDQELFGVDVHKQVQAETTQAARRLGVDGSGLGELAGSALGAAFEWGSKKVDDVKSSHPKTADRIVDSETYIGRQYPDAAGKAVQVEAWDAAKDQDETADILENYIAAIEAKGKLAAGDVAAARKLAKTSLSGPTKAHAYPNYVDAAVQLAAGETAPALADYQTALSGSEPAGAIYSEASALYFRTGKNEQSVEVIESGYARLQQPPSLTVPLIRAYRQAGRQADADRIAATCAARWPTMQSLCLAEAQVK